MKDGGAGALIWNIYLNTNMHRGCRHAVCSCSLTSSVQYCCDRSGHGQRRGSPAGVEQLSLACLDLGVMGRVMEASVGKDVLRGKTGDRESQARANLLLDNKIRIPPLIMAHAHL